MPHGWTLEEFSRLRWPMHDGEQRKVGEIRTAPEGDRWEVLEVNEKERWFRMKPLPKLQ